MKDLPPDYLDMLSNMLLEMGDLEDDPEFAPLLAVIRRGMVVMRNPDDFVIENFEHFYRELLTTAHNVAGLEPISEMLAALVGLDFDDS